MNFKLIKTEEEYGQALDRLEEIFDAVSGTPESDEADVLALIIEAYESEHHQIEPPDPIEAIKIRMEEMDLRQKDLVGVIGGKSRVSEILNRKKKLTIEMARILARHLNLSAEVLIGDYKLTK